MKTIHYFLIVFLGIFSLSSCEKLEELTTIKIPVSSSSYSVEIKNIRVVDAPNGNYNTFEAVEAIGVRSIDGVRENELNNLSHVTKIKSGSGSVTVISDDGSGSVVEDFVMKSDGVTPDLRISQCALGVPYTDGIAGYLDKLVTKILSDGDRNIRVSGKTDVQAGKTLTVKITLEDIVLYIQVID